jgi:hypothetical protein
MRVPLQTDAHYQLGRMARMQNRLQEALDYFSTVIEQDDRHSHHEVWREIGLRRWRKLAQERLSKRSQPAFETDSAKA